MTAKKRVLKGSMKRIAVKDLHVHPEAQRAIVKTRLARLIADFDLDAVGVLYAVEDTIDGTTGIWIVDGQHRYQALLAHELGDWVVDVEVYDDASQANHYFLKLNDRAAVSAYDKFVVAVNAGWPTQVGIQALLDKYELKAGRQGSRGVVKCFTALERIYLLDAGVTLDRVFAIIRDAWGLDTSGAIEGVIIEGLGRLLGDFDGTIDLAALRTKLSKVGGGPSQLIGRSKGWYDLHGGSLAKSCEQIIIVEYNKGRRTKKLEQI